LGVNTCKHNAKLFFSVTAQKDIGCVLPERMSCGSIASEGFDDIEMCFNNCTQQCLSQEPFLAVALSTVNMNVETFQTTVSTWKQSLVQRTVGGLDGELHELLFFAAIQLASHSKGIQLCGIMDFIQEVKCYICKAKQEVTLTLNEEALKRLRVKSNEKTRRNISAENIEWYSKQVKTPPAIVTKPGKTPPAIVTKPRKIPPAIVMKSFDDIKEMFANYKIPWLVPAARSVVDDSNCSSQLFGEGMIAHAFVLRPSEASDWVFEFRARSSYSLSAAVKHLEEKCEKNKETNSCHAMLLAVRKGLKSQAAAWTVQGGGNIELFRIAVVLGGSF